MILRNQSRRSAASAVEMAFIAPVFVFLLFALIVGGLGIFRYNQIAHLARQGARYASVRGQDYHIENNKPAATQDSVRSEAIIPNASALDPSSLTVTVTWNLSNAPKQMTPDGKVISNYVIVTVSYNWIPEWLLKSGTMTCTSKMPVTY